MDNDGEFLTASSLRSQRHHMNHNALNDQQIDSLIADALGITHPHFSPCNNINDAWPIIEKYNLALIPGHENQGWIAIAFPGILSKTKQTIELAGSQVIESNPLRAAMIALLRAQTVLQLDV
ncbi:phage protein NinX family protein [Pseudaeromonas sharmana]|uniref:Phage protein NinX family protein n=1 Tax=Pseudaeromonas sharmana TaxID=328412 RepID=A0ABV8CKV2_9GAMM